MDIAETTKAKKTKPEPKPSVELTLPERAAVALGTAEHEVKLLELAKASADIVEVTNVAGRDQAHRIGMNLRSAKTRITSAGKAAREDPTAFSKAVIAEENRLVAIIEPEEKRVLGLRDEFDANMQAEKDAKIAAERARIDGIRVDIQGIRNIVIELAGKDSKQIEIARMAVDSIDGADEPRFDEFTAEASKAIAETSAKLTEMFDAAVEAEEKAAKDAADREAEAMRLADERAELDRRKKEQDEAAEVERKKLADERAKQDKEREEADAKAAALRKVEDDKREVERKRVENELAGQRAELARQQEAINAARREQEEAARAAQAKIDADAKAAADAEAKRLQDAADEALRQQNEEHIKSVNQELHHFLCCDIGLDPEIATKLIAEIAADNAPHLTITY